MSRPVTWLAGLTLGLTLAGGASAAFADPIDWTVDAGLAARLRPTHIGADRFTPDVVPILNATVGDDLQLSLDDGAKWTALRLGAFKFGPIAEFRQSFNDHLPPGAYRMNDAIELGGFASAFVGVGEVEVRLRKAVTGYEGWSGDVSFDTGAKLTSRTRLAGQARLAWADSRFSEQYFALQPTDPRPGDRPRFSPNDYFSAGAELDLLHDVGPRMTLVTALTADRILGPEIRSPILATRDILTVSVGFTYHWGSSRPAADEPDPSTEPKTGDSK